MKSYLAENVSSFLILNFSLWHPVSYKDIRIALSLCVAVRCKDQFLAVGAKHRKAVKCIVKGYLLQPRAVRIDGEKIEVAPSRIIHV